MNRQLLPRAAFTGLVVAAVAAQAAAAGPAVKHSTVRPQLVDDATLAQVSGKYLNQQMLIGLRIDLVSTLSAPQGTASATGSLLMQADGLGGMSVRVDSRSQAQAQPAAVSPTSDSVARGADALQVNGIGQVVQIAGDGNRMANLARISFGALDTGGDFNGRTESLASDGALVARIRFDEGVQLGLSAPGVQLQQRVGVDSVPVLQSGQIASDHVTGSNQLQLQLMTRDLPVTQQHRLGIQQALSGLAPIGR